MSHSTQIKESCSGSPYCDDDNCRCEDYEREQNIKPGFGDYVILKTDEKVRVVGFGSTGIRRINVADGFNNWWINESEIKHYV